ncbi:RINT1-like protein MAG2 isoform X4 [Panicum hallii]|uniref:RINT1-like protein MAG2 isoform X4 n=1 Tax=Panicum hallii TaxID=206008 RepID=UPI000DF4D78D|nr:RINT1-like protein MAG2 isoform X4 [Panicum hallii]
MEAAAPPPPLPLLPDSNPGVRCFLDGRFRSAADLATAADVEAEIRGRCAELEALVSDLSVCIYEAAAAYSSCREAAGLALRGVRDGLGALKASISTGVGEEVEVGTEKMQFEQLPALASEVARVEMVREYAETALKLDSLVGDVEDAVSFSVTRKLKSVGDNSEELQKRRKARQLKGHNVGNQLRQPLWILRDFVDSMDEILQPLVDKAKLIGYSCREEWISGMVIALSSYLAKEIFPKQIELLQESSSSDAGCTPYQARVSWLSLVDLMISFDKRTQDLISGTGLLLTVKDDDNWQRISVLSVFCDRPDWLEVWAEIEKQETLDKLKSAMESEKNWSTRNEGTMLEYGSDDYKSPVISAAVQQSLSLLIDRARPIPSIALRAEFIRMSASPIISEFLGYLLRRCQEAEGLTALADDNALLKVSQSINAARYFESTLTEWCEDVFYLEMENLSVNGEGGCIFQLEINHLKEFRVEWVSKITTVILRAFDSRSRDYLKNKRQWQEKSEGPAVSRAFIESLDYMQGQLSKLEGGLNALDFVTVWRSVASGVDQLLFSSILTGGTKISNGGVERLQGDLSVLFAVFSAWCLRPEGFFPRLSEGLRLLKLDDQQVRDGVFTDKNWLREHGIRHLTAADTEKVIKNGVYEA